MPGAELAVEVAGLYEGSVSTALVTLVDICIYEVLVCTSAVEFGVESVVSGCVVCNVLPEVERVELDDVIGAPLVLLL